MSHPALDTRAVPPIYLRLLCQTQRRHGVYPEPVIRDAGLGSWAELSAHGPMGVAAVASRDLRQRVRELLLGREASYPTPAQTAGYFKLGRRAR